MIPPLFLPILMVVFGLPALIVVVVGFAQLVWYELQDPGGGHQLTSWWFGSFVCVVVCVVYLVTWWYA